MMLALVTVAGGALLPATHADAAPVNVTVCTLTGSVHLTAGEHLGATVSVSPFGVQTIPSSGTYTFGGVTITCAGMVVLGTATITSIGNYAIAPPLGLWNGAYTTGVFAPGSGNTCAGNITGNSVGTVVVASLTVNCTAGLFGGLTSTVGEVVLAAVPNLTALNTSDPTDPVANDLIVTGTAVFG